MNFRFAGALFAVLLLFGSVGGTAAIRPVWAQAGSSIAHRGYPPFRNYTPEDYGNRLQSQNWSVTQDEAGLIYVANPNGVLVYDGVRWRLVPTDRQTLVRTVVTDTAGTVYAGAYGEIGMLQPDSTGALQYVSLLDEIDPALRDFGHTWTGAATSEGVYFQTRQTLFQWNGTAMRHWSATDSTRFERVFSVHDTLYVMEQGVGLEKMVDGQLHMVPGGERFATESVYAVMPYDNGLLIGTEGGQLYRYVRGQVEPFPSAAQPFLAENELYDGVQLTNGNYALATLRGGVLIMTPEGTPVQVLGEQSGLVDDDVKSLFVDQQGGLWMACERGIARVDVLSPLSYFDERSGLDGVGLALARQDSVLYAGTSSGIFRLVQTEGTLGVPVSRFESVPGLRAQVFDLASTATGLLAATEKGVFLVRSERIRQIGEARTAVGLHQSQMDSSVVYVGYIDGIGSLRRAAQGWQAGPSLPGFNKEVYFLEEDRAGMLWAASAYGGLWRVEVTDGLRASPSIQQFASEDRSPRHVFRMARFGGRLHLITRDGLATPMIGETGQVTLQPDSSLSAVLPEGHAEIVDFRAASDGDVWLFTEEVTYWIKNRPGDTYEVATPLAHGGELSVFNALAEPGGVLWIAAEEGIVRHKPRSGLQPTPTIQTLIRRVATVETDSLIFGGHRSARFRAAQGAGGSALPDRPAIPRVTRNQNALRFEYAAPGFGQEDDVEYQYRLVGFTDEWSSWTSETRKDYTNLPSGTYEFQVRARHPRVWEATTASFRFKVLPPWYRTLWAYGLFGLMGVALIAGAVWWRSAHLEARARKLEQMVHQRTEEVQTQAKKLASYNRELRQTNEVLQDALEQKSELLGIAAHDLKNPLFGIRGLSEILLEQSFDESVHRKLSLIYESADETLELINDLLESAAASSGQVRLDVELIDMKPPAEWVVHSFRQQAEKKGQHIHFQATDEDTRIEADERKLREAMSNLVSNAVKYSPKGARIDVEVQRKDGEICFLVRDEGPGLSEKERRNLFAPFQRLSPEPTAGEASSGLGLYIVKQLVELHEGRVWVDSKVGEGSTFGFALPAAWTPTREVQTAEYNQG